MHGLQTNIGSGSCVRNYLGCTPSWGLAATIALPTARVALVSAIGALQEPVMQHIHTRGMAAGQAVCVDRVLNMKDTPLRKQMWVILVMCEGTFRCVSTDPPAWQVWVMYVVSTLGATERQA